MPSATDIIYTEARASDLPSLATIVPRSFHAVNPYIKSALPDTPALRSWWISVFTEEQKDPSSHLLVALDTATDQDIGILAMRLLAANERGAGFWTTHQWSEDHDPEKCKAMIDSMVEHRERLMLGRDHYLIELFGTEHEYKGTGVGTKLLARACEIADGDKVDMFVQANASATGFYARLGFTPEGEAMMPGGEYKEYMMVRQFREHGIP